MVEQFYHMKPNIPISMTFLTTKHYHPHILINSNSITHI